MNRTITTQMSKVNVAGLTNISPKTMMAAVLMGTMLILWGRVLLGGKHGPQSAEAQQAAAAEQSIAAAAAVPAMELEPVALHCLPGRNDALTADVFSSERWTAFDFQTSGAQKSVEVNDDGQLEEKRVLADLDALSGELALDAVIQGRDGSGMQAFVGDKVLTVGQTLTVKRQSRIYEFKVTEVTSQEVVLTWQAYSIRLKMTESHEQ